MYCEVMWAVQVFLKFNDVPSANSFVTADPETMQAEFK